MEERMRNVSNIAIDDVEVGYNGGTDGNLITYHLTAHGADIIQALFNAVVIVRDSRGHELDSYPLVDAPLEVVREAERKVAEAFLEATKPT
jgi:hypothetical protein